MLLAIVLLGNKLGLAQPVVQEGEMHPEFYASPLTQAYTPLQRLGGPWALSIGRAVLVPFTVQGVASAQATYGLRWPDSLKAGGALYLEGLSCQASLCWDDRLLVLVQPFQEVLVPLPAALASPGTHTLSLQLQTAAVQDESLPAQAVGIPRQVWLLAPRDSAKPSPAVIPPNPGKPDSTLRYVAYSPAGGFTVPALLWQAQLRQLSRQPCRWLYFPLGAPGWQKLLAQQSGFKLAQQEGRMIAYANSYTPADGQPRPFWLDAQGDYTAHFKQWVPRGYLPVNKPAKLTLLLLACLPLTLLLLWKLLDSNNFNLLLSNNLTGVATLDKLFQLGIPRSLLTVLVVLVRITLVAVSLTYLRCYLQAGNWHLPGPLGYWLQASTRQGWADEQLLAALTLGIAMLLLLRYTLLRFLAGVYRKRLFVVRLVSIELAGCFPFLLLVCVYGLASSVVQLAASTTPSPAALKAVLLGWGVLAALGLVKYYLVLVVGLARYLSLPLLVIVLYICALEILPLLLLTLPA